MTGFRTERCTLILFRKLFEKKMKKFHVRKFRQKCLATVVSANSRFKAEIIPNWVEIGSLRIDQKWTLSVYVFRKMISIRNYDLNQTTMFSWFICIYNWSLYLNPNLGKILLFDWLTPRRDNDDHLNAKKNVLNLKPISRNLIQSNHVTHYQITGT